MTAPEKSAMRMPWMTAPTTPTASPAAGPNANPLTMAGMAEASYLSHVTPGSKGNSMNDSSTPMAHMSAMVTSCRVSQRFVFVKSTFRPSSAARAATGESAGLSAGTSASAASAATMASSALARMVSDMMSTFLSRGVSVRVAPCLAEKKQARMNSFYTGL